MRKILLSMALVLLSGAAMAQNKLEFTFNRSTNTVTATIDGAVCPDITASIAISPSNYLTASNCANDSILAINRNTTAATADDPNTYTLTINGLKENCTFSEVIAGGVAVNSGGTFQGSNTSRSRYFKVAYGENAENLTTTEAVLKTICDDSHCSGNPTDNTFTVDGTTTSGSLTIKVQVYTDSGLGCFYGLTSITLVGENFAEAIALPVTNAGYATMYASDALSIPTNIEAYIIKTINDGWVELTQVTGIIPAETGFIVKGSEGEHNLYIVENANTVADVDGNLLKGSVTDSFVNEEAYVLGNIDGVGLYKAVMEDGSWLNNAGKAYLPASAVPNKAVAFYGFDWNGTTGIENVVTENGAKAIFDLTGRRVEAISAPGIYIVNGKKVLVK